VGLCFILIVFLWGVRDGIMSGSSYYNQHHCCRNLRDYYILCHKIVVTWTMWELTELISHATNQYHPWRRWWQDGLWTLEAECCMGSWFMKCCACRHFKLWPHQTHQFQQWTKVWFVSYTITFHNITFHY